MRLLPLIPSSLHLQHGTIERLGLSLRFLAAGNAILRTRAAGDSAVLIPNLGGLNRTAAVTTGAYANPIGVHQSLYVHGIKPGTALLGLLSVSSGYPHSTFLSLGALGKHFRANVAKFI